MKKTGKNVSQKQVAKKGRPKTAKPIRETKVGIPPEPMIKRTFRGAGLISTLLLLLLFFISVCRL